MKTPKRIMIVGAGWLGTPLARALTKQGHYVLATCRDLAKHSEDTDLNWAALDLAEPDAENRLKALICDHQIDSIIGSFPPGFRQGNGQHYAEQWQRLSQVAQATFIKQERVIKKVLMISSTSVYPTGAGNMFESDASLALTTNNDRFSDKARVMLKAERALIKSGLDYVILRCSGLIGPNRYPARFVAKLPQVSQRAPANMVHLDDVIGATLFALAHLEQEIVNVSTPNTVSKAEFYQAALEKSGSEHPLPPVVDVADKRIIADKLVNLGYSFKFTSTLDAL